MPAICIGTARVLALENDGYAGIRERSGIKIGVENGIKLNVQHTPAMRRGRYLGMIHDELSELEKQFTLERFGKEIRNHIQSRAVFDFEVALRNAVRNKIVPYI